MKPSLLTFSFLLLFVFSLAFSTLVDEQVIVDTNGNPIFPGGRYYLMPPIFGAAGGGVKLGHDTESSTCPVAVFQDYSEVVNGLQVKFIIPGISPGIIFTGTTLNISFVEKPECVESSIWAIVAGWPAWIGIGGDEDHQESEILTGKFNIQKHGLGYKFVFCPTYTIPPGSCYNIVKIDDVNGRRLILPMDDVSAPIEFVLFDAGDVTRNSVV